MHFCFCKRKPKLNPTHFVTKANGLVTQTCYAHKDGYTIRNVIATLEQRLCPTSSTDSTALIFVKTSSGGGGVAGAGGGVVSTDKSSHHLYSMLVEW